MISKQTFFLTLSALTAIGAITASAGAQTTGGAVTADADGAFASSQRFNEPDGETMYRRVCAACHMADGKGSYTGAGFYPSLANSQRLEAGGYPAYVVVKGMHGMPGVGSMMTDQQVADVVNYVRTHFGNAYTDPVTAADVEAIR
jgi:mono/diheme cytochrome c family protein